MQKVTGRKQRLLPMPGELLITVSRMRNTIEEREILEKNEKFDKKNEQ